MICLFLLPVQRLRAMLLVPVSKIPSQCIQHMQNAYIDLYGIVACAICRRRRRCCCCWRNFVLIFRNYFRNQFKIQF